MRVSAVFFSFLVSAFLFCALFSPALGTAQTSSVALRMEDGPHRVAPKIGLAEIPVFDKLDTGAYYSEDGAGTRTYFSVNPALQMRAEEILSKYNVPWGALVAVNPRTGRVLAIASHSRDGSGDLTTRATFPAASLFKLITSAAAIERTGMRGSDRVYFRGGNYTLERYNYNPDARRDKRVMTAADALGKSCNPVFARIALNNLSPESLTQYAQRFGFNNPLPFDVPVQTSRFTPPSDDYEFARTAAGFGDVKVSPLHGALIASAFANGGRMMRPYLIDRIVNPQSIVLYRATEMPLRNAVSSATAGEVQRMMIETTTSGTAKKHFSWARSPYFSGIDVAGKTGTLRGDSPKGLYHWFIGSAPAENPEVAVSSVVIEENGARVKGSGAARMLMEAFFHDKVGAKLPPLTASVTPASTKKRYTAKGAAKPTVTKARSFTKKSGKSVIYRSVGKKVAKSATPVKAISKAWISNTGRSRTAISKAVIMKKSSVKKASGKSRTH